MNRRARVFVFVCLRLCVFYLFFIPLATIICISTAVLLSMRVWCFVDIPRSLATANTDRARTMIVSFSNSAVCVGGGGEECLTTNTASVLLEYRTSEDNGGTGVVVFIFISWDRPSLDEQKMFIPYVVRCPQGGSSFPVPGYPSFFVFFPRITRSGHRWIQWMVSTPVGPSRRPHRCFFTV